VTPVVAVGERDVTTVEGLPARWARQHDAGTPRPAGTLHPVQQAWIDEQVPQCGFCQYGMMIKVTELLEHTPQPSDAQIMAALTTSGPSPHLCRCGSYAAILEGARRAARLMSGGGQS
jgi:isoquinoline 1-oxidoreductase subunit alpha